MILTLLFWVVFFAALLAVLTDLTLFLGTLGFGLVIWLAISLH